MIGVHLKRLSTNFDELHKKYDNFIIIGDFNSEANEDVMNEFCCLYNLTNMIKEQACFKNPNNSHK